MAGEVATMERPRTDDVEAWKTYAEWLWQQWRNNDEAIAMRREIDQLRLQLHYEKDCVRELLFEVDSLRASLEAFQGDQRL